MTSPLEEFGAHAQRLRAALLQLEPTLAPLTLPALQDQEWFELLDRKLCPQLGTAAFLIVAVTGATNAGKSVIFNHLAGFRASESSPLAARTKHPVCLVPEGLADQTLLAPLFPSFTLIPWQDQSQAVEERADDVLFWRTHPAVPANLVILDTPDIDSTAVENWARADAIRQAADVLIAVLTGQNYNDAAVKQFFRKAAHEDKVAVVVFNQLQLPEDEVYWPQFLVTFREQTGLQPEAVYLGPSDRKAAEALALEFHERSLPSNPSTTAAAPEVPVPQDAPSAAALLPAAADRVRLQDVFARLRFGTIKLRTLRGSLAAVVAPATGVPAFLEHIKVRSGEFQTAADLLSVHRLAEVKDWPTAPAALVVAEVRHWWATQREGWALTVHNAYNWLGDKLWTPIQYVREQLTGPVEPPWKDYRQREWDAIVRAIKDVYDRLEWLRELGNPLLRDRLERLLQGTGRKSLLEQLRRDHDDYPLADLLQKTVVEQLLHFRTESPEWFALFRRVDDAAAAARPALTVVLGLTGIGLPLGEAAAQLASQGIVHVAMHAAGDLAAGAAVATGGEAAISHAASTGTGYLQARFHQLQTVFTQARAVWLATRLDQLLLGSLTTELQAAAAIPHSAAFHAVERTVADWAAALPR